jgi:hypothetical protein
MRLATSLRPLGGLVDGEDLENAHKLLLAAQPVLEFALGEVAGPARAALLQILVAESRRVNEPVPEMIRSRRRQTARELAARLRAGAPPTEVEAALNQLLRDVARKGKHAPPRIAERIRRYRGAKSRLTLTSFTESGLRVREVSNGVAHRLLVHWTPPAESSDYVAQVSNTTAGACPPSRAPEVSYVSPLRNRSGTLVFAIPLDGQSSRVAVRIGTGGGDRDFQPALGGGIAEFAHRPSVFSPGVRAALADWHVRRGFRLPDRRLIALVNAEKSIRRRHLRSR